jgi:hemolysin III
LDFIPKYLREPFNCISHGMGALLSVFGLGFLLYLATTPIHYLALALYGGSLILLYTCSAIYHGLDLSPGITEIFNRLDRASIYVFIAGTTTPVALIALHGWIGWTMFTTLWTIAAAGVMVAVFKPFDNRIVNTMLYLGMGWISLAFIEPLTNVFSTTALLWCVLGGVLYSVGAFVYAFDWPRFHAEQFGAHELWHLFVLAGSTSHFVFIAVYTV